MIKKKAFLFLQGMASPFFSRMSGKLQAQGYPVYRINFCGGDVFFSANATCWNYRSQKDQFSAWLKDRLISYQITDIVLFGDNRFFHKQAIAQANALGLAIHVFEEGYIRPHSVTLDKGGVNAFSSLPKDPEWYRENGNMFPKPAPKPTGYSLMTRAWHDICYHVSSFLMRPYFAHYRTHRPVSPWKEYLGWIKRFPLLPYHEWKSNRVIEGMIQNKLDYYFLPLQLNSDSQIVTHSPFEDVCEVIEKVVASYARHAPSNTHLVIKNHPLDTGLVNYRRLIKSLEQEYGLQGRLVYLEDGYLPTMVHHAKGTILVNSTVGTSSLFHGIPTCVLGEAIYDMEGLTYQGGLDRFWLERTPPDKKLFTFFSKAIVYLTQVNGDFYSRKGIEMTVEGSMKLLGVDIKAASARDNNEQVVNAIGKSREYVSILPPYKHLMPSMCESALEQHR